MDKQSNHKFISRIMLLNLLNLFSLIIALFKKIETINKELDDLRNCRGKNPTNFLTTNETFDLTTSHDLSFPGSTTSAPIAEATAVYGILHAAINDLFPNILPKMATIAATAFGGKNVEQAKKCISVPVNCSKTSMKSTTTKSLLTSLLAMNFATTILPEITSQLNGMDFSSTTTSTYPDWDFFYNSTIFDDNETTVEDENGLYSNMGSTTTFPFDGVMRYDYKSTTPTPFYSEDYYTDDSNVGGKFVVVLPFFFMHIQMIRMSACVFDFYMVIH